MTKTKAKSKSTTKASAAKAAVTKSAVSPGSSTPALIVLGYDEQQKPRGARFVDAKPDLVTKAADLMGGLKVSSAPACSSTTVPKAVSISLSVLAFRTCSCSPRERAASRTPLVSDSVRGVVGLTSTARTVAE